MTLCEKPYIKRPNLTAKEVVLGGFEAKDDTTPFPCGRCLPCRLNKARMWQARMLIESLYHSGSCYITLTYNEENLPDDGSVSKVEVQRFIKRLRHHAKGLIKYFMCGEYGDEGRPHYHGAIFGVAVEEVKTVEKAWDKGFVCVSGLGPESARYISGYIVKGWNFDGCDKLEGRKKEFQLMSKGLGKEAAERISEKGHKKYVREIQFGKVKLPLGRFLTSIANKHLSEEKKKEGYYDWQDELMGTMMSNVPSEFVINFMESTLPKRNRIKQRQRIFKRKVKI